MGMDTIALLRNLPLFQGLDDAMLARLAERCVPRTLHAGELLIRAGEPCRGLYILASGRLRVYRVNEEGKEQVLHVETAGRPVAELPLFDGGTYPASVVAIDDSKLAFLSRADFEHLYSTHPEIAHAVIRSLGRRLRHFVQLAETLAFRDVAARLAMLLTDYARRAGERTDGGVLVKLDRTQEELAHEIGTARESVSRAIKQLRARGLIRAAGRSRVLIPDVERLSAVARGGH